jgi:hypothetical protein
LGEQMAELRQLTSGSVKLVTDLVKESRWNRVIDRTNAQSNGRAGALLAKIKGANVATGAQKLASLRLDFTLRLEDTSRLVELGSVLARSAKIEAAYGGAYSAPLMQVSTDFENIIGSIKESLEGLRKNYMLERRR